jgi:hypothetical protein
LYIRLYADYVMFDSSLAFIVFCQLKDFVIQFCIFLVTSPKLGAELISTTINSQVALNVPSELRPCTRRSYAPKSKPQLTKALVQCSTISSQFEVYQNSHFLEENPYTIIVVSLSIRMILKLRFFFLQA